MKRRVCWLALPACSGGGGLGLMSPRYAAESKSEECASDERDGGSEAAPVEVRRRAGRKNATNPGVE